MIKAKYHKIYRDFWVMLMIWVGREEGMRLEGHLNQILFILKF